MTAVAHISLGTIYTANGQAPVGAETPAGSALDLDRAAFQLEKANTITALIAQRAALQKDYRDAVMSSAAIKYFSQLDPGDPEFREKFSQGQIKFSDVIGDDNVKIVTDQKREDAAKFRAAMGVKASSNFTKYGEAAWQKTYDETGKPERANAAAQGADALYKRWANVFTSAYADAKIQAQLRNSDGSPNFDAIEGAELILLQRENASKPPIDSTKNADLQPR